MQLRIMTYNIHRAIGVDRRFRPERIVDIIRYSDPDIVLMQEVDEGAPRSRELDLAKEIAVEAGFPHHAVGHNVQLRKGRYGNATLSRWPILRERNIDLSVDARKRRGCQHTTIVVEKKAGYPHELEIFNLHLGLSVKERARQVGTLVRSHEFKDLDPARSCLVGGDFNDWRSLLHSIFTEVLEFHCATQDDHDYEGGMRTYPSFRPTGALDKLYYRGPLRALTARTCRRNVARVASDHLPVVIDLEIRG